LFWIVLPIYNKNSSLVITLNLSSSLHTKDCHQYNIDGNLLCAPFDLIDSEANLGAFNSLEKPATKLSFYYG
jgi:hypothetical protein